jgi:hypothetical protein
VNDQDFSFCLQNSRTSRLTLWVEPWGEVYKLAPGAKVKIQARGPVGTAPPNDSLIIQAKDDSITLWGWTGSGVTVSTV